MRIGLIGSHPDGLDMARALVATGRHELAAVLDAVPPDFAPPARVFTDLEELLADPAVELVIVAGAEGVRFEQLRRGLQSERPVLCVHPCADKPEPAYQAAVIQSDVNTVLLPLLPDALHPAWTRLAEVTGELRILHLDCRTSAPARLVLPWDVLRRIGGEIVEVSGFAAVQEWDLAQPLLLHGRFAKSGLLHAALLPASGTDRDHISVVGSTGEAELDRLDERGAATLRWHSGTEEWHEEKWASWDRWAAFVPLIEAALAKSAEPGAVAWQDEIRGLELDDAVRRSVEKRRASDLDFPEYTEEVGSKGTLTLIGCGMIWLLLLICVLAIWVPWALYLIVPLLLGFLGLLALKWLGGRQKTEDRGQRTE